MHFSRFSITAHPQPAQSLMGLDLFLSPHVLSLTPSHKRTVAEAHNAYAWSVQSKRSKGILDIFLLANTLPVLVEYRVHSVPFLRLPLQHHAASCNIMFDRKRTAEYR